MRHLVLLRYDGYVNLAVATEIERLGGRHLMPRSAITDDARMREAMARRVLSLASGAAVIPHWVDRAAHEWCVQWIMKRTSGQRVDLTVDGASIGFTREHLAHLLAEGLVGLVLEHAADERPRKLAEVLGTIERLGKRD